MKSFTFIYIFLMIASTSFAQINKDSESTWKLPSSKKVTMDLPFARNIVVKTWDRQEVLLKTAIKADNEEVASIHQMNVTESADALHIKTDYKKQSGRKYNNFCSCDSERSNWNCVCIEIKHEIFLPKNAILSMETINGSIEIKGFESQMHIESINGFVDITFSPSAKADLDFSTINGEIYTDFNINNVGKMSKYSKEVRSQLNGGGAELELETINGNIYFRKGK
ncbi:MAG: hypothetical protein SFU99_23725 [Saprospiraceae bacterium]|nr:hypothetical protein [Saprospiraceae bacterium]